MPLRRDDIEQLRDAGFLDSEISKLSRARAVDGSYQNIDINTPLWQAAMDSRREWIEGRQDAGWSPDEIRAAIQGYYRGPGRSPFDFLKAEYQPPKKVTDFQFAVKLRARARIERRFGKRYLPKMAPQKRPSEEAMGGEEQ